MKRIVVHPYGFKWKGGIVMSNESFLKVLKQGDVLEVKKVQVGTKQLASLVRLMPHDYLAIHVNGRLEIQAVEDHSVRVGKDYKVRYRTPRHDTQFFGLMDKAWLPEPRHLTEKIVVLRPQKL